MSKAHDLLHGAATAIAIDELDLSEEEIARADIGRVVAEGLVSLRLRIKREAGRSMTIDDYLLPERLPANVVDLFAVLQERASRTQRPS